MRPRAVLALVAMHACCSCGKPRATSGKRLLMKLTRPGQAVFDPSAIGPTTLKEAKAAGVDAIVMSCSGLIFERAPTLLLSQTAGGIPIYGCPAD